MASGKVQGINVLIVTVSQSDFLGEAGPQGSRKLYPKVPEKSVNRGWGQCRPWDEASSQVGSSTQLGLPLFSPFS